MSFARRLAAVLVTVASVIALGVAWAHSAEASWLAGPAASHPARFAQAGPPLRVVRAGPGPGGLGLHLANSADLIRTAVIEAVIMVVVVAASAARRHRRRRARRPA